MNGFIDFVKFNPWTCAIGALIFLTALVGVIYAICSHYGE